MKNFYYFVFLFSLLSFSCSTLNEDPFEIEEDTIVNDTINDGVSAAKNNFKMLSLGDSYTI